MTELKIEANLGKGDDKVAAGSVTVDFPDTTEGLVAEFGEEAVYSRARSAFVIDIQSLIRTAYKADKKPKEIQEAVDNWTPGVKAKGKTTAEKADGLLSKLSDEERAELFKRYSGKGKK